MQLHVRNEIPSAYAPEEDREQQVIRLANRFDVLAHDFDDSGVISSDLKGISSFVFPVSEPWLIKEDLVGDFTDAFLSLQVGSAAIQDLEPFLGKLAELFSDLNVKLVKGETTFTRAQEHYAVIGLGNRVGDIALPHYRVSVASIDSFVLGRHFRPEASCYKAGFYSACAALSDIGASGAIPSYLFIQMVNPEHPQKLEQYLKGVKEACAYMKVELLENNEVVNDSRCGEMALSFVAIGSIPQGKEPWTLKGLKEGMRVYLVGSVGGAAYHNYDIPIELLKDNLDPDRREQLIAAVSSPALCNDISDGVAKSIQNLLHYADNLDIQIDKKALLKAAYTTGVSLEQILNGGDDYSLLIATEDNLPEELALQVGIVI